MASAPHCRNILSAAVDLGVGTKGGLDPYYTQNFGDYYSRPVNETARAACPYTVDLDALTVAPPAVATETVATTSPQPRERTAARATTATAKPSLSALSLSSRRLRAGGRGTTISFRLSAPATVTLRVQRANGRGSRYRTMAGGLVDHQGVQGRNTVRFDGSLNGHKLRPGRYRLQVFATDATDRESAVRRIRFAVVRR